MQLLPTTHVSSYLTFSLSPSHLSAKATWFSVTLSVILLFLKIYPPFQVANCPVLPGLSSLKIKSDETNLFCIKIRKKQEIYLDFFGFFCTEIFFEQSDLTYEFFVIKLYFLHY
jgi:hypothetical protein